MKKAMLLLKLLLLSIEAKPMSVWLQSIGYINHLRFPSFSYLNGMKIKWVVHRTGFDTSNNNSNNVRV